MFLPAVPLQDESNFADVVRDWHHDLLHFIHSDLPRIIIILLFWGVVLWIVLFFVSRLRRIADSHAMSAPQRGAELRTVASVLRATAYGVVGFIVVLHILNVLGIPTASLLAGAGLISVGVGLGAQSLFKDVINGIFILIENQFNVGDTITAASLTGTVEELTLRLTTLRDGNGTIYFIPNSQIATVSNLSRDFAVGTLALTVDASADPDKVLRVLRQTALAVRNDPQFKDAVYSDPDVPGVDAINGRVVTYPITIRVRISRKDALMRELRRRILQEFEQNGIPLGTDPANMLLMKHADSAGPNAADPTAPPAQQPLTS